MALTPNSSFSTLTLLPSWGVSYSVEFKNREKQLGNSYTQITDGGTANPSEIVSVSRAIASTAVDSAIADLRSYQGSTAFNWRLFPGGNYKLYFCTSFGEELIGYSWDQITAEFTRHPNPIYDPQPAAVADGRPWGVLTQPIRWGASQSNEANPLVINYRAGEVEARRALSLFNAQSSKRSWSIEFPNVSSARLAEVELFLRQRRGRIPFQFDAGFGTPDTLWICSQWRTSVIGQRTSTAADMRYSMSLELRQVYRGVGASAISLVVPNASISPTSATIAEGSATSYTVTLSSATASTVSVPFTMSGTAVNGTDYTVPSSPLTIASGSTTANITVNALTDALTEGNETAILSLGTPTNATLGSPVVATTTITNVSVGLPTVTLSSASGTAAEGSAISYTLTLSSASASTVTVPFTLSGTATLTTDYTVTTSPITITAGSTTGSITVTALTDAVTDVNETVIVALGTPTNANLGAITSCTTTITDVGSFDTEAQTFFTAATITDTTQKNAVNTLVVALKANGTWSKYHAIYPLVGASATSHSYNLKNPATFQVTWSGTITHDANGIVSTSADAYGVTGYNPTTNATLGDNHLSIYSRTLKTQTGGTSEFGGIDANGEWNINLGASGGSSYLLLLGGGSQYPNAATTNTQGWFVATRSNQTTLQNYRNNTQYLSAAQNQTVLINKVLSLLAVNDATYSRRSSTNIALATVGLGLTQTEVTADYSAIQAFQTSLGRSV